MARTQIKAENILDHSLTGASFRNELRYYDETANYSQGARVTWAGREYIANTNITGGEEGDLSNAPNISSDWSLYTDEMGQLAKVSENNKIGFRLRDSDPDNFGDIGSHAIDLSFSDQASNVRGATGDRSFAVGENVEASGINAAVFGSYNKATSDNAFAEGQNTQASGMASHAEGLGCKAKISYAHAEGYYVTAGDTNTGYASHAEGFHTTATGDAAHAEGGYTTASGKASHASGYYTTAAQDYQAVFGRFNSNKTDTIFEIGIGINDTNRWNAFDVYIDGTATLDHTTSSEIDSRGLKAITTIEWVQNKFQTFNFDPNNGDTSVTVSNKIFSKALVFINGVLQRDNSYTISDDGTDTTITFDTSLKDNDWVSITTLP